MPRPTKEVALRRWLSLAASTMTESRVAWLKRGMASTLHGRQQCSGDRGLSGTEHIQGCDRGQSMSSG